MDVGDEIQQAAVCNKWSKAPLGKKSECKSCDGANKSKRRRSTAGEKAGGEAHESGRKDERVKTLPGDPEKGKVANGSANDGTK